MRNIRDDASDSHRVWERYESSSSEYAAARASYLFWGSITKHNNYHPLCSWLGSYERHDEVESVAEYGCRVRAGRHLKEEEQREPAKSLSAHQIDFGRSMDRS